MLIVPFAVRISFMGTYGFRPWANVWDIVWFEEDQGARNAGLVDIADRATTAWDDSWQNITVETMLLNAIKVQDLNSVDGQIYDASPVLAGASSAAGMPPNVSSLNTKVTSHSRSQRNGRWFQAGHLDSYEDIDSPGNLTSGGQGTVQAAADLFMDAWSAPIDGQGILPVVLSRGPSSITPQTVTSLVTETTLATQRRRLRK